MKEEQSNVCLVFIILAVVVHSDFVRNFFLAFIWDTVSYNLKEDMSVEV